MRFAVAPLAASLLTSSLLACSNASGVPQTTSTFAEASAQKHVSVSPGARRGGADTATFGIYAVASMSTVNGYAFNERPNGPPVCSVGGFEDLRTSDIAVDRKGDLLVADGGANSVTVFGGPGICGPKLGTISDPFGTTVTDVASRDGQTIVVAYGKQLAKGFEPGVAVCTLSGGCARRLRLGVGRGGVYGVAIAPDGDCWAAMRVAPAGDLEVAYFAHCRGKAVIATGVKGDVAGGLDIDAGGNLVVIGASAYPDLTVYSGCNPACTLVGGPFSLKAGAFTYGHLDGRSNKFVAAQGNLGRGQVDVYNYSPSAVTYAYRFTNGLMLESGAAAYSPSSKE